MQSDFRKSFHEERRKGLGSSDAPIIMGHYKFKTPLQLWEEKVGITEPDDDGNWATDRGNRLEPQARAAFELEFGDDFPPVYAEHINYPFLRANLDGFNEKENVGVEIKCPSKELHAEAVSGKVPDIYYPQVQEQIMVTNAKYWIYYSYDGERGVSVRVEPDLDYIKELLMKMLQFWELVTSKTPPDLVDQDLVEDTNPEALTLAEQYIKNSKQIKLIEKENEAIKKKLTSSRAHPRTRIGSLLVTRTVKSGAIDYSKVDALKDVDLEQFRKAPSVYYTLKETKQK